MIRIDVLRSQLDGTISKVLVFESIDSTNRFARNLITHTPQDKTLVIAESQTKGRGRYTRFWASPPGGVYLSLILHPDYPPEQFALYGLLAGCAVRSAISDLYGLNPQVKWPNDVLVNGRKIAGILSELVMDDYGNPWVILGIGVNANTRLTDYSPELQPTLITLVELLSSPIDIEQLIIKLVREIISRLDPNLLPSVLAEWRRTNITLGRHVTVNTGESIISGIALDITRTGSLLIQQSQNSVLEVITGDVTVDLFESE